MRIEWLEDGLRRTGTLWGDARADGTRWVLPHTPERHEEAVLVRPVYGACELWVWQASVYEDHTRGELRCAIPTHCPPEWAAFDGKFQHLKVGQGVTLCYPQDRYGYVVVKATAKRATVVPLTTPSARTGEEPARFDGPFPVWAKTYTQAELDAAVARYETAQRVGAPTYAKTIAMHKDGVWWMGGDLPVGIDGANYYRTSATQWEAKHNA